MDTQLKAQLAQTIYVAHQTAVDTFARPTFGTATSMAARVENEQRVLDNGDGSTRTTTHVIITESAIVMTDRVWLPGDSQSDATLGRRPAEVVICIDEDGDTDHYETRL